jgi:hypothetical protein
MQNRMEMHSESAAKYTGRAVDKADAEGMRGRRAENAVDVCRAQWGGQNVCRNVCKVLSKLYADWADSYAACAEAFGQVSGSTEIASSISRSSCQNSCLTSAVRADILVKGLHSAIRLSRATPIAGGGAAFTTTCQLSEPG